MGHRVLRLRNSFPVHLRQNRHRLLTVAKDFLDPEGGCPNATLLVLVVVVIISSLKIPKLS